MKRILLFFLLNLSGLHLFAQKHLVDSSVFGKWPIVEEHPRISNDGKYVMYTIESHKIPSILNLQATHSDWKKEIPGAVTQQSAITENSRFAIVLKPGDSLAIVTLGTDQCEYIPDVSTFKLPNGGNGEWLVYQSASNSNGLVLRNLLTGHEQSFFAVVDYLFSDDGKVLLMQTESKKGESVSYSLQWMTLKDKRVKQIWQGDKVSNMAFDNAGNQLAFIEEKSRDDQPDNLLWYYQAEKNAAVMLANNQIPELGGLKVNNGKVVFSQDGTRVFFQLKPSENPKPQSNAVKVEVWSYKDDRVHSDPYYKRDYVAVVNTQNHTIIRLDEDGDDIFSVIGEEATGDYVLIKNQKGDDTEYRWNKASQPSIYLVSTKDGTRRLLKKNLVVRYFSVFKLSPKGKYVLYYDQAEKNYFSYDIASGVTRNLTRGTKNNWSFGEHDNAYPTGTRGIGVWLGNDERVLIYDDYDIWQLDPTGNKSPVNITNSYGRNHTIRFQIAYKEDVVNDFAAKKNTPIILAAFNIIDKSYGFYSQSLGTGKSPELLTMASYVYNVGCCYDQPKRARDANAYLIRRMSATEAPNLFITTNFKTYNRLTDVQPQKTYNWLTTELVTWKMFDGNISQGILYKPENFDPLKKYPVIFHYYEKKSDNLNVYLVPDVSEAAIDIPYCVSNGYLVFTPDIYFTVGQTGQSIYNSVVSAALHLRKLPFVDSTKMGIQGFSFGGYETNYLVAHTDIFAAAVSGGGLSDHVSFAGSLRLDGTSNNGFAEASQSRIGASLWENPQQYIDDSPIFRADKVTTPLLLMSGKKDGWNLHPQNLEFFLGLRRLGKKVWMLAYDEGQHGLGGKDADDFTIRMTQFFDHYLKGAAPAKWMTEGVAAGLEGRETGLELDMSDKKP